MSWYIEQNFPIKKEGHNYTVRHVSQCLVPHVNIVFNGSEFVSHMGPIKIWELIPSEINQVSSPQLFKRKFNWWKPEECPCRRSKHFIAGVGCL